ncbi:antitoxin ParD1/3/4 [Sphingomonas zeicaulis]
MTEELATDVDQAVASGDYASSSEVIREALRQWKQQREADQARIAELRRLMQEGLDSGEPQALNDAFFDDIITRGMARLAARKAAE